MNIKVLASCLIYVAMMLTACGNDKGQKEDVSWADNAPSADTTAADRFTLNDILYSGELIMLTKTGPDTYFEYHGRGFGTQFMLCEKLAQHLGVSLRVETCSSDKEMLDRLHRGEADIIVFQMKKHAANTIPCGMAVDSAGTAWAVDKNNGELAAAVNEWYDAGLVADVRQEESKIYRQTQTGRRTSAPMLNKNKGIISAYDHLFMRHSRSIRWDWRLLAAQCYQESAFDPNAVSWAGAQGLMQIMPSTARQLGLDVDNVFNPEDNIETAVRYLARLNASFADVRNHHERIKFMLAGYNGGTLHIRDAMALAAKHGKNKYVWQNVAEYVLKLSSPEYYNDPVVRYGYMRGHETADYVDCVMNRWMQYRGKAARRTSGDGGKADDNAMPYDNNMPHRSSKKHRFKL